MFTTRKWWLLLVAALLPLSAHADGLLQNRFLAAGAGTPINNIGTAIGFHKITWNVSGTASVCTVALDTSADGITWSAGGAIAGQTCTSNGSSTVATVVANYVRMNMTALTVTAGSSVSVTWTGYVNNPAGGGGGSIVSCTAPTANGAILFQNGTTNTATCDPNLVWDPTGGGLGALQANADGVNAWYAMAPTTTSGPIVGDQQMAGIFAEGSATVNSPNTNHDIVAGILGDALFGGTGDQSLLYGSSFNSASSSSGIVGTMAAYNAQPGTNSGGGTVNQNFGYRCDTQNGVSSTLNACFYAVDQGTGANDYALYTVGGKTHLGPTTAPGVAINNGNSDFSASNYGVKAGGYKFCDANIPAAGAIVTIGNDAGQADPDLTTLGITTSWIAWTSTWNCASFNPSFAILNAVGTVASVDSATQLHLSTSSASSCAAATGGTVNKCALFIFPQDDTTAISNWWTAMTKQGTCGQGKMWSGLALISTLPLASTGGCTANNTGNGSWSGVTIEGTGVNSSVLVINPTTNVAGCGATTGCLFALPATSSAQNDIHIKHFSVDGGGQSAPTGNTAEGILLGADSTADDFGMFSWGIVTGMVTLGSNNAPVILHNVTMSGVGSSGGGELNAGPSTFNYGCNLFWGPGILATYQGNTSFGQSFSSGCSYGFGRNANGMVQVPASKFHVSVGDYCNNTNVNSQACWYNAGGTLDMTGTNISLPDATGNIGVHALTGSATIFHGFNFIDFNGTTSVGYKGDAGSLAFDTGWLDANLSTTPFSIAGTFIPNEQVTYPASMSKAGATGTGACATITTNTGNILAGSLKCTGTTGASTIVLTPGITATNGWTCTAVDLTTNADTPLQTATAATTCTLGAAAIATNDVIAYSLRQF